jgi:hypothetical protein
VNGQVARLIFCNCASMLARSFSEKPVPTTHAPCVGNFRKVNLLFWQPGSRHIGAAFLIAKMVTSETNFATGVMGACSSAGPRRLQIPH